MTRDVIVRPEAEQDLRDAHAWYRKIAPVLGEQFISAVDQAITSASDNPLAFQALHRSLRRVLLRRFPYALFFAAEASSGAQSTRCSEAALGRRPSNSACVVDTSSPDAIPVAPISAARPGTPRRDTSRGRRSRRHRPRADRRAQRWVAEEIEHAVSASRTRLARGE